MLFMFRLQRYVQPWNLQIGKMKILLTLNAMSLMKTNKIILKMIHLFLRYWKNDCNYKMDRKKLKSSFRLSRSHSLHRSPSINQVSPSLVADTFWHGRVEQKLLSDWQPVWIRINNRSILSYKNKVGQHLLN